MEKKISNIVFTKNRPLQLEAYLESLYHHIPREMIQTYIIYKEEQFDEQYSQVFSCFPDCVVIREKNFHDDLVGLLNRIDTKYVLFGTDDVVYYDSVNFAVIDETFELFQEDIFGFSLRLNHESLEYQEDTLASVEVGGEKVYRINWKRAQSRNAKYPFELNSTVYTTSLVRQILARVSKDHPMLKKIFKPESFLVKPFGLIFHMKDFLASLEMFNNPNTLEGYCYRWCRTHKHKLPSYLYFQKACASAVQVNRVNTSAANPIDGLEEHTVESLNEKYKQGYRLDIDFVTENKPKGTHCGQECFRLIEK
jgi:hypothetical protein